jgi:signal transduction histidine kinase
MNEQNFGIKSKQRCSKHEFNGIGKVGNEFFCLSCLLDHLKEKDKEINTLNKDMQQILEISRNSQKELRMTIEKNKAESESELKRLKVKLAVAENAVKRASSHGVKFA